MHAPCTILHRPSQVHLAGRIKNGETAGLGCARAAARLVAVDSLRAGLMALKPSELVRRAEHGGVDVAELDRHISYGILVMAY